MISLTAASSTTPSTSAASTRRRHPFWRLARVEALLFARSPGSVVWTALLPVAAIIVLGAVPGTRRPSASFDGQSPLQVYLPILMIYVFLLSAANLLPAVLSSYREKGILRRLSTTPVPPMRLLGAQGLIYLGVGVVIDVVLLVVAICAGVPLPRQVPGFAVSMLLVAVATLGIGLLITAFARTERIASALGMLAFFPSLFFAGMWIPRATMPHLLRTISDYTPTGAGVRAVGASLAGHWPAASPLLVLLAYTIGCGAIAARRFRWQ